MIYIYMCIHIVNAHAYPYTYAYMYVCIHVYVYTDSFFVYVCTYVYIHTSDFGYRLRPWLEARRTCAAAFLRFEAAWNRWHKSCRYYELRQCMGLERATMAMLFMIYMLHDLIYSKL